jgi:hypothetical protein
MPKLIYEEMPSLYTVIADYLSLGISRETIGGVKLEIAARETFPAFPLNGSNDAMLTAIDLKIDELERIFIAIRTMVFGPNKMNKPFYAM